MLLSPRMRRLLLAALAAALVVPAAAGAAEPIMPLGEVAAGHALHRPDRRARDRRSRPSTSRCSTSSSAQRPDTARILVRVSGPAIDATGLGPGFSGSPIYCPDGAGVARNIGAISDGIGEYGGAVGLATPIEAILAEPVLPPSAATPRPRARASPAATASPRR